jgi:hypothetical protein
MLNLMDLAQTKRRLQWKTTTNEWILNTEPYQNGNMSQWKFISMDDNLISQKNVNICLLMYTKIIY